MRATLCGVAEPAFEELLTRLQTIVDELERGELPLDVTPVYPDASLTNGTWGGQDFTNLMRNPSAEAAAKPDGSPVPEPGPRADRNVADFVNEKRARMGLPPIGAGKHAASQGFLRAADRAEHQSHHERTAGGAERGNQGVCQSASVWLRGMGSNHRQPDYESGALTD